MFIPKSNTVKNDEMLRSLWITEIVGWIYHAFSLGSLNFHHLPPRHSRFTVIMNSVFWEEIHEIYTWIHHIVFRPVQPMWRKMFLTFELEQAFKTHLKLGTSFIGVRVVLFIDDSSGMNSRRDYEHDDAFNRGVPQGSLTTGYQRQCRIHNESCYLLQMTSSKKMNLTTFKLKKKWI